jgi:dipeptidyl aminopeptidase/acylaminoacyl peptidase
LDYCKSISADWGDKEVSDILGATDYVVKNDFADPERLGIGGWSYGGMLTDYTIATDTRFKAAISGAGVAMISSVYGSDQYILQYENELGFPWENFDKYMALSYPFLKANRIKTPTLFLSGQSDFNVPTIGSEQMYQALKSLGIPSELIVYPGEYHGFDNPRFEKDRYERYIRWFNKYLKK